MRCEEGNSLNYRYGYQGFEADNEVSGQGNSYTTLFRQYDPRLGRWKSLDPLMHQFPWMSPYVAFDNNPVFYTDPYGLSPTNHDEKITRKGKGAHKGDKKNREEYLRNQSKVNDGTTITFEYPDSPSSAQHTYTYDGSNNTWHEVYTYDANRGEGTLIVRHDYTVYGSEENRGGEIPLPIETDPSPVIETPTPNPTTKSPKVKVKSPIKKNPSIKPLKIKPSTPDPNPIVPDPPLAISNAKFTFRDDWFPKGTERTKAYTSINVVVNYLKENPTQVYYIHIYVNAPEDSKIGKGSQYSGMSAKALAWGRYMTIRDILRRKLNDSNATFPYVPHFDAGEFKFEIVPKK